MRLRILQAAFFMFMSAVFVACGGSGSSSDGGNGNSQITTGDGNGIINGNTATLVARNDGESVDSCKTKIVWNQIEDPVDSISATVKVTDYSVEGDEPRAGWIRSRIKTVFEDANNPDASSYGVAIMEITERRNDGEELIVRGRVFFVDEQGVEHYVPVPEIDGQAIELDAAHQLSMVFHGGDNESPAITFGFDEQSSRVELSDFFDGLGVTPDIQYAGQIASELREATDGDYSLTSEFSEWKINGEAVDLSAIDLNENYSSTCADTEENITAQPITSADFAGRTFYIKGDGEQEHTIAIFNADGSGTNYDHTEDESGRPYVDTEDFTWSVADNKLTLVGMDDDEEYTDTITVTSIIDNKYVISVDSDKEEGLYTATLLRDKSLSLADLDGKILRDEIADDGDCVATMKVTGNTVVRKELCSGEISESTVTLSEHADYDNVIVVNGEEDDGASFQLYMTLVDGEISNGTYAYLEFEDGAVDYISLDELKFVSEEVSVP